MTAKTGSCLCGAVRYEVHGELRPVMFCYCEQCRRTTGNFVSSTACLNEDFELIEERGLKWYASSDFANRAFCSECGSSLFWRPNGGRYTSIWTGTLDSTEGLTASSHIYIEGKPHFLKFDDGLPQHEGYGPEVISFYDK